MHTFRLAGRMATLAAAAALIAGCDGSGDGQKLENCWSPQTKQNVTSLAKEVVVEHIVDIVKKTNGSAVTAQRKSEIETATNISLSNVYVAKRDTGADHLTCGATVNFTFTRGDKKTLNGNTSAEFDLFKAENGYVTSIAKAPLVLMVESASAE